MTKVWPWILGVGVGALIGEVLRPSPSPSPTPPVVVAPVPPEQVERARPAPPAPPPAAPCEEDPELAARITELELEHTALAARLYRFEGRPQPWPTSGYPTAAEIEAAALQALAHAGFGELHLVRCDAYPCTVSFTAASDHRLTDAEASRWREPLVDELPEEMRVLPLLLRKELDGDGQWATIFTMSLMHADDFSDFDSRLRGRWHQHRDLEAVAADRGWSHLVHPYQGY